MRYAPYTMAEAHVISALKDKRARLDGEIQMRRFQITRLEMELAHIDAVIRMFRPGYDVSKIATKRSIKRSPAGTIRGSGTREALTVLREAQEPLTSRQIADRILAKHGKPEGGEDGDRLANSIHGAFSRRNDGALHFDASIYPGRWSLASRGET
jgi:hypothetical protein